MSSSWHQRWKEGRIGFHQTAVHEDLITYQEQFLSDGPHRVLVPLCGKTQDLVWLAKLGHQAIGVELVPQAVEEFFQEQELEVTLEEHKSFSIYSSGAITIYCGDFFDLSAILVGKITRVWDRAALVALPLELRGAYCRHLRSLVTPDASLLLNVFEYDPKVMSGPPHSISPDEVETHFADCDRKLLSEADAIEKFPGFAKAGHSYWTVRNYLIAL